ncbi:MAG: alpha/beta hydrolase-fold protein [Crocinitomicaceae bacterium]|nr:alpha/beta hydrolase-fold protein [Crocinitomicaceae bacterium]
MNKFLFLISIISLSFTSIGQNISEDSIYFERANSYRTYKVWTPEDYDPSQKYIPIYCLDASLLFNVTWANAEILSWAEIGEIPPVIVVGVFFDQRNDDMTINWENGSLGPQGIAFKEFLFNDVHEEVSSSYNVSYYSVVVGHSNSSTYIQDLLLDDETPFSGYIGMSQYEIPTLYKEFNKDHSEKDYVFTSASEDAPFRYESGFKLEQYLDSIQPLNLNYTHLAIEGADHISMVNWTIANALERLFAPYNSFLSDSIDFDSVQVSPLTLTENILKRRDEKYGTGMTWGWNELNFLYDAQIAMKDSIGISVSTMKYAELFPEYHDEYFLEGQILEQMGAYHTAEKSYLTHFEVFEEPGEWSFKRIIWLYAFKLNRVEEAMIWCDKAIENLGLETFVELRKELEELD